MTAENIIFNALVMVHDKSHDGIFFCDDYLQKIAKDCVENIREEFRNAGVNVWPTEGRG